MRTWREIQRENFIQWRALATFLELSEREVTNANFPLNLPRRLAEKMEKGRLDDPILCQFLPRAEEGKQEAGYQADPVGDAAARRAPKLLHKYEGRALLLCSSACAMHCRYCFRQNFSYETGDKSFGEELRVIGNDPSLTEIILSGGDPLSLSNETLQALISSLSGITHLKRLRFHTRFPIGIPERIDAPFLAILERCPLQIFFVVHVNHPKELDADVLRALKSIQKLGIPVLNQAVLLRGVNDDVATLKELCEKLANHGILPYYLNQLDPVAGSSRFAVEEQRGLTLVEALTKVLSGYAVPLYVKELAGAPNKVRIQGPSLLNLCLSEQTSPTATQEVNYPVHKIQKMGQP